MTAPWVHWIEQGAGARWLARIALVSAIAVLSGIIAYKQFRGPLSEETLRQANLGRALAAGQGFSSAVNYPQAHAFLQERGWAFGPAQPFPEMYHAPGYGAVIGAVLALLPDEMERSLFASTPIPPDGFGADYFLLGLNLVLLWLAGAQTWWLARRLFDGPTAMIAALGLLLSVSIWDQALAVNGTPLAMVLLLGLFQAVWLADAAVAQRGASWVWWGVGGGLVGLLFLTDYPAGMLLPVVAIYALWRQRWIAAVLVVAGGLAVTSPWLVRNYVLTGRPLALATQDLGLRHGDSTADPVVARTTFAWESPPPQLRKLANKLLTTMEDVVRDRVWSAGGLVFTAFFVSSWLYRFRRDDVNRLRLLGASVLVTWVLAQGVANSGEAERHAAVIVSPLIIIFGAGFFGVLAAGRLTERIHLNLAAAALLALQAAPLAQNLLEPRGMHFSYPPYYPGFFQGLGAEVARRGGAAAGWMADVPEGAAWYSGRRVWAQPAALRDFFAVHAEQPLVALVLTPRTLDRPFFTELTGGATRDARPESRFGSWARIYRGLGPRQVPTDFPLHRVQRVADNCFVLLDPHRMAGPVN
jgi:hypothetical protein